MNTLHFPNVALPQAVKVRDKYIGPGNPTFVISEIGNNHNGDMELALRSIEASVRAGADAVKFQRRNLKEVFTQELLSKPQTHSTSLGKTYGEYRSKLELTDEQLRELKDFSHSLGVVFFVTPFDKTSVDALDRIGMDAWKIASFDAHHVPLLEYVAKRKEPMFLSTGMTTPEEMDEAVRTVIQYNPNLVINHCVSVYPTPDDDLNLGAIRTIMERYRPLPIGYSGHEVGFIPTIAAVALGVCAVERHFTLDKTLPGPDHSTVSLDPAEFGDMVRQIRRIEKAVADANIYMHEKEIAHRNKHGKSIVSRVAIPAGTLISDAMLTCKSPGYGIKPALMHTVIGRRAKVDIAEDTTFMDEYLMAPAAPRSLSEELISQRV